VGQIEDHYRRQAQAAQVSIPPFYQAYNNLVDIWSQIRTKYLAGINQKPPAHCDWITLDGQEFACWELWSDRDCEHRLFFLSDGRVASAGASFVAGRTSNPRVLDIQPLPAGMTMAQAEREHRTTIDALQTLCQSALGGHSRFVGYSDSHEPWLTWHLAAERTNVDHYRRESRRQSS
jgi:hypothetical protein